MKPPKEFDAFTEIVDRVLAVPNSVVKERLEEHRKEVEKNPQRRGPKQQKPKKRPALR